MKQILYIFLLVWVIGHANAQTRLTAHAWNATLRVVDETGQPVINAETWVSFYLPPTPDKPTDNGDKINGVTDINGIFKASHTDRSEFLGFHTQKRNYYTTSTEYALGFESNGDPLRWNPDLTLVLKRVRNPIPMYAKQVNLGMPAFEKPIGFDLMIGDWVAPYGRGINTHIVFSGHLDKRTEFDSDYVLTVSFPNRGDGIQEFSVPDSEKGSELRSPHEAPTDGYQSQWIQTDKRRPRKVETNRDLNRNYYFRVHTVLDQNGNIKSALYGKIYGDFMQFAYYLNPTPNDRNIEFDPKQNLIKSHSLEADVRRP